MTDEQLMEFACEWEVVHDNDAFFFPVNADMEELINVIQLADIRANQ